MVIALTDRIDLLLAATDDLLHQGYRAPAMPESAALVASLRTAGVPAVISGAGPTVLVLADAATAARASAEARAGFTTMTLAVSRAGGDRRGPAGLPGTAVRVTRRGRRGVLH
jgi:homoserine kinase